ncbi:MAG: hypothetical protein ACFFCG_01620 [Promethearchaeota archaeon]
MKISEFQQLIKDITNLFWINREPTLINKYADKYVHCNSKTCENNILSKGIVF